MDGIKDEVHLPALPHHTSYRPLVAPSRHIGSHWLEVDVPSRATHSQVDHGLLEDSLVARMLVGRLHGCLVWKNCVLCCTEPTVTQHAATKECDYRDAGHCLV